MLQSSFIRGDSTFLALWPRKLTKRRGWYAACHSGVVWVLWLSAYEGKSETQIFPVCAHVFIEMFGFAWGEEWCSERRVIDGISEGMKAKGQKCWAVLFLLGVCVCVIVVKVYFVHIVITSTYIYTYNVVSVPLNLVSIPNTAHLTSPFLKTTGFLNHLWLSRMTLVNLAVQWNSGNQR